MDEIFPEPTSWNGPIDPRFNEPGQEPDVEGMARDYEAIKLEGLSSVICALPKEDLLALVEELWDAIYLQSYLEPPDEIYQVLRDWKIEWFQLPATRGPK